MSEPLYTLHLGDCLEVLRTLPDCSVDAVVTDPPYLTTDLAFDKVELTNEWIVECLRVLKPNGYLISFGSMQLLARIIPYAEIRWDGCWVKPCGTPRFHNTKKPMQQSEYYIVFCKKGAKVSELVYNKVHFSGNDHYRKLQKAVSVSERHGRKDSIKRKQCNEFTKTDFLIENTGLREYTNVLFAPAKNGFKLSERTEHPTQKPVQILSVLIQQTTNEGALILDPFMGSGSTCIAALEFKRRFIGCEIDPVYFEIAKNRIEKRQSDLRLF